VKTWVAVLVLLAVEAPCAERHAVSPLSRRVHHFSIGRSSALNALLWLGHDEGLCLGIEFSSRELDNIVRVEADNTTVREVIKKIMGSSDVYRLSVSDGVILIRKKGVKPPTWLDHRLPQFELPRMELMWANIRLSMMVELDLDPSLKGFAGDYP